MIQCMWWKRFVCAWRGHIVTSRIRQDANSYLHVEGNYCDRCKQELNIYGDVLK